MKYLLLLLLCFMLISCETYNPQDGDYVCFSTNAHCHEIVSVNRVILVKD